MNINNHFAGPENSLEKKLFRSEKHYQPLFENIHDVVFQCDNRGRLTYINQSWEEVLGYSVRESLGHSIVDFLHEKDNDTILSFISREEKHGELRFRHRNGKTVWLEMSVSKDHKGENIGLLYNVTVRKSKENKLKTEQEKLYAILDRLPAFVCIRDKDFYITFCNSFFIEQFGHGVGKLCHEVMSCDENLCKICRTNEVFKTNIPRVWEFVDSNTHLNYQIYDYPFKDIDGSPLVLKLGIVITNRKTDEADRKKLIKDLEEPLATTKKLEGFLPICASCKNIRDDKGSWNQVDEYISKHTDVEFTHSICPSCKDELYPELKGLN